MGSVAKSHYKGHAYKELQSLQGTPIFSCSQHPGWIIPSFSSPGSQLCTNWSQMVIFRVLTLSLQYHEVSPAPLVFWRSQLTSLAPASGWKAHLQRSHWMNSYMYPDPGFQITALESSHDFLSRTVDELSALCSQFTLCRIPDCPMTSHHNLYLSLSLAYKGEAPCILGA